MSHPTKTINQVFALRQEGLSIRQIGNNLNISRGKVERILKLNININNINKIKTEQENKYGIKKEETEISLKNKNKLIHSLLEIITLKSLKELKKRLVELNPKQLADVTSLLISSKTKLEKTNIEDQKLSLVKEIFGSYQDMLKLKKEITNTLPEEVKIIDVAPEEVTEVIEDKELEYLKLNS
jgi:IS30 family transposase